MTVLAKTGSNLPQTETRHTVLQKQPSVLQGGAENVKFVKIKRSAQTYVNF
jgi:hypothetical protein